MKKELNNYLSKLKLEVLQRKVQRDGIQISTDLSLLAYEMECPCGQYQLRTKPFSTELAFQRIIVDPRASIDASTVILAHEYGHAIDFNSRMKGDPVEWYFSLEDLTLELEEYAWMNAVRVLKTIGFYKWDVFFDIFTRSYRSYIGQCIEEGEYPAQEIHQHGEEFILQITEMVEERDVAHV